jgi:TatD DNase family protein
MISSVSLVDTHCHLQLPALHDHLNEVLKSAADAGVISMIIPGIDLESSMQAIKLAGTHDNLWAAVGFHPHEASSWNSHTARVLRNLAESPNVIAIGEIGLDYFHNYSDASSQHTAFHAQMELARELDLPVIIHNREASEDIVKELEFWAEDDASSTPNGVLHAFSADHGTAARASELGYLLGIGGPLTYKNADTLRSTGHKIGLESLVLETDAPYLTPHPHRGKQNQPAFIKFTAEVLAAIFHTTISVVANTTTRNANSVFALANG